MGLLSKDITSLDELFMHGLQDLYYAEKRIIQALPKMIDAAADSELRSGLQRHLRETEKHVERLESVFEMHDQEPRGEKCPAIEGIITEGDETLGEVADDAVRNAAIIAAAQAVEHYEITRYGTLIAWAKELGRNDAARVLKQTLAEEKAADQKLSAMAEKRANPKAPGAKRKTGARGSTSRARGQGAGSRTSKSSTRTRKTAASARRAPTRRKAAKKASKSRRG